MDHFAASTLVMNPSPAGVSYAIKPSSDEISAVLLQAIRQQIEWYFSDQNLPRDVFLNKLLQLDETGEGWVQLKVVSNFNKIKQMTTQLDLIREALRYSSLIMVSEDGIYIRRKTPIMTQQAGTAPEKRSIYVSKVPKNCDKEYLSLVFGEYGTITRLDLPTDKKTGENKGIAFVEYRSEEEMLNAMQTFSSAKYKMVLKPFKPKAESSKESVKHEELQSKEIPHGNKHIAEDAHALAAKSNEGKAKAVKQPGDKKEKQKKKEKGKDTSGEQNGKEIVGREVPIIPDSVYDGQEAWSGRNRSNSKGSRLQTEWDPNPSNAGQRPKLHLKGQMESGRALFVPIRNPLGPTADGKGFLAAGRGKMVK